MFICFEGIDGSGKSTHLNYFIQKLKLKYANSISTREPGGTSTGEQLRVLLLHHDLSVESQIMLAFASRQIHIQQVIQPALDDNKWVISDRFVDSTYAYQGYGKKGNIDFIDNLHKIVCNSLYPDLTILFDIDPIVACQRRQNREISVLDNFEKKSLDFHQDVRNGYLKIAKHNQAQGHKYIIINADDSIENIQKQLDEIIFNILGSQN